MIEHVNRCREKHNRIQYLFIIKKLNKMVERRTIFFNIVQAIYHEHIANHTEWWKTEALPPKLGTRQDWSFSPLLFNIVWKVLVVPVRQEKKYIKGIQIGKGKRIFFSSFCIKNTWESTYFLFICLVCFGPFLAVLRTYSFFCTQKSLGSAWGTLWDNGDSTWVGCVQSKRSSHCAVALVQFIILK